MNPLSDYSYIFMSGSCCSRSLSFPPPSPDRPTLYRLRFQDISLVSYWTWALTPYFSVPVFLAKISRRYHTNLSAKTAVELARCARGLPCASCVLRLMGGAGRACALLRRGRKGCG